MRRHLIFLGLGAVACSTLSTHADWDPSVNLKSFSTYQWRDVTPVKNQLLDQRIVAAVNQALTARGLRQVDSGAQLSVTYRGSTSEQLSIQSTGWGYGAGGWYPGWGGVGVGTTNTTVNQIPIGTLVIDVVENKSNQMVWRSTATDELRNADSPQQAQQRIDTAVNSMFHQWPKQSS